MKILFIGDIYGSLGRQMIQEQLPKIKETYKPHFIIANGENISHGKGINEKYYKFLLEQGVNVVTLGNHTWLSLIHILISTYHQHWQLFLFHLS